MEAQNQNMITVACTVNAPVEIVWEYFTKPDHIIGWYFASDDWHAPRAENDIRTGGKFLTRMEAKDGSFGFDFEGIYSEVVPNSLIHYGLADGRQVIIKFTETDEQTTVTESFDPENQNPAEMQQAGWQMILDNFKKYTESN